MEELTISTLRQALETLIAEATRYFEEAEELTAHLETKSRGWSRLDEQQDYYWSELPEGLQREAKRLVNFLVAFAGQFASVLKSSPLISESDQRDLMIGTKTMRAALYLRRYVYSDAEILHDEGTFVGVAPARQSDDVPQKPIDAKHTFADWGEKLSEIVQLVEGGSVLSKPFTTHAPNMTNASRYRPGTAFIIMSMDKDKPELDDIRDVVKEVFNSFGIRAIRADDIEHEGLITKRVLDEISTSEFLFADLTGERPNVYYEVGYAHALGKRVILYRKTDAPIHFDLAGYNCPPYKNLSELRDKLTKRLADITNKSLSES